MCESLSASLDAVLGRPLEAALRKDLARSDQELPGMRRTAVGGSTNRLHHQPPLFSMPMVNTKSAILLTITHFLSPVFPTQSQPAAEPSIWTSDSKQSSIS